MRNFTENPNQSFQGSWNIKKPAMLGLRGKDSFLTSKNLSDIFELKTTRFVLYGSRGQKSTN